MEDVLEVYSRPYDSERPVICFDEASKQLVADVNEPLPVAPGLPARVDYEYERIGTANIFMASEPLAGKREVTVTDRRTNVDFAHEIRRIVDNRPEAKKIILVLDNLSTHSPAALYEAFPPAEARRVWERLEVHYTPKHASWLNMAECELSVLNRQCLDRRIPDKETLAREILSWQTRRNETVVKIDWQFTTTDARIKLKRLYPINQPR